MENLHCRICGEAAGEFRGADLIVHHNANDHAPQISLKDILQAAAVSERCLLTLREFYDENAAVKFIVK